MEPDVRMEMPACGWETAMPFLPFGTWVVVWMESLRSSDGGARMR